jgi:hypothetical protein
MTNRIGDVQAACSGSLLMSVAKSGIHLVVKLYGRAGYLRFGNGKSLEAIHPERVSVDANDVPRGACRYS